jgi:hypothetical protein
MRTCNTQLIKKCTAEFKNALNSLHIEFPKIYDEIKNSLLHENESSNFPKILKGGNPGSLIKFLIAVIAILFFYYIKNPIQLTNTSIEKTFGAARTLQEINQMCYRASYKTIPDPISWRIDYAPENSIIKQVPLLGVQSRTGPEALIPSLLHAQLVDQLLKYNPSLNLDKFYKKQESVISVCTTSIVFVKNVLYINFAPLSYGLLCNSLTEYKEECNFFNMFDSLTSMENTEKFVFQFQFMLILVRLRLLEGFSLGLFSNTDSAFYIDEYVAARKIQRPSGFHIDTNFESDVLSVSIVNSFANEFPILGTEVSPPFDLKTSEVFGIYRSLLPAWATSITTERIESQTITLHSTPYNTSATDIKDRKSIDMHLIKDREQRETDELIASKYKETFESRPPSFIGLVKQKTVPTTNTAVKPDYVQKIKENIDILMPGATPFSLEESPSEFAIVIEGFKLAKGDLYNSIINAINRGSFFGETPNKVINKRKMYELFKSPEKIRESMPEEYKRIKGGKSRKKKSKKTKQSKSRRK